MGQRTGHRLRSGIFKEISKTRCTTSQYSEVSKVSLEREGGNSGCHSGTPDAITPVTLGLLFWDSCYLCYSCYSCYSRTVILLLWDSCYSCYSTISGKPAILAKSITFNHSELVTILPKYHSLCVSHFCQAIISFQNSVAGKNKISEFILHSDSTHTAFLWLAFTM